MVEHCDDVVMVSVTGPDMTSDVEKASLSGSNVLSLNKVQENSPNDKEGSSS